MSNKYKYENLLSQLPSREALLGFPKEDIFLPIPSRFEKVVKLFPERIALSDGENDFIDYQYLNLLTNRIANGILKNSSVGGNSGIAIFTGHELNTIVSMIASMKAGKYFVTIDPDQPIARIKNILNNSGINFGIVDNLSKKVLKKISTTFFSLNLDTDIDNYSSQSVSISTSATDLSTIIYTSGSTGKPKGVPHTHTNILLDFWQISIHHQITETDRSVSMSSLFYGGVLFPIFMALLSGGTFYLYDLKKKGLNYFPEWVSNNKISIIYSTATLYRQYAKLFPKGEHFPDLRLIHMGGETIRESDILLYQMTFEDHVYLRLGGGTSESMLLAESYLGKNFHLDGNPVPIGYIYEDKEILICDKNMKDLGINVEGEIVVRGKYLSPGYKDQPKLSAKSFFSDPEDPEYRFYKTGDLGILTEDGILIHRGRIDQQVKIRGYRVELGEIESVLEKHPDVKEIVVVGIQKKSLTKLAAYIVPEKGKQPKVEALRERIAKNLPDFMQPSSFTFIDKMPQVVSGKIDRNALPVPTNQRPILSTPFTQPENFLQAEIAKIWAEELELDSIGINDKFTDLGGDSLTAEMIFIEIEKSTMKRFPPEILLQSETVKQLEWQISNHLIDDANMILVPLQKGTKLPIFMVSPVGGSTIAMRDVKNNLSKEQTIYGLNSWAYFHNKNKLTTQELAKTYVNEILKVQSEGPYVIGGFSYGGVIAFEVAQQLFLLGKKIGFVYFLDSAGPGFLVGNFRQPKTILKTFFNNMTYGSLKRAKIYAKRKLNDWRVNASKLGKIYFFKLLGLKREPSNRIISPLSESYFPNELNCDALLFYANQKLSGDKDDKYMGWDKVIKGKIHRYEIPSNHLNIMYGDGGIEVAKKIQIHLDKIESDMQKHMSELLSELKQSTKQER